MQHFLVATAMTPARCRPQRVPLLVAAIATTTVLLSLVISTLVARPGDDLIHPSHLGRRLATIPLTEGFYFDGRSSDLAQQFYRRHVAGDSAPAIQKNHDDLPARIKTRLDAVDLRFEKLPPLLQRAVIWDSGYALNSDPELDLVKLYTVDGVPMSKIALSVGSFIETGCRSMYCNDPDGAASYRSWNCTGDQLLPATLCASEPVAKDNTFVPMWASGGVDTMVPNLGMVRHAWNDPSDFKDYVVFSLHTMLPEKEPTWDNCPKYPEYSSLVIPCSPYMADLAADKRWLEPQFGPIVSPWLKNVKSVDRNHTVLLFVVVPLCVLLVILVIVVVTIYCRRRALGKGDTEPVRMCGVKGIASHLCCCYGRLHTQPSKRSARQELAPSLSPPLSSSDSDDIRRFIRYQSPHKNKDLAKYDMQRQSLTSTQSSNATAMLAADRINLTLINDLNLYNKRVPLERIYFQKQLSQGAFGEVWLCELDGQRVAVKRLLQSHNRLRIDDVETFADEIQITASLHHPNIPKFLGVAWTTLDKLCMVTEYMPGGDLQSFLKRSGQQLSWSSEKKTLAIGIAKALQYLHSRAPVMIHRDLKSRNILVRDEPLAAKVMDFGVSRSVQRECMTLGVGTPYWTAPEVLDGTTYTEKSDMYSFGIVLSEIDTCQSPYHELQYGSDSGIQLQPFHILKMVISGTIQPRFSMSCPLALRELAMRCLNVCPESRPTAREVVKALETME